jgi:hypothetical protein
VSLTPQYHSPSRLRLWRAPKSFSSIPAISISNAQQWPVPQANFVRTIYHGLPEQLLMPAIDGPDANSKIGNIRIAALTEANAGDRNFRALEPFLFQRIPEAPFPTWKQERDCFGWAGFQ